MCVRVLVCRRLLVCVRPVVRVPYFCAFTSIRVMVCTHACPWFRVSVYVRMCDRQRACIHVCVCVCGCVRVCTVCMRACVCV